MNNLSKNEKSCYKTNAIALFWYYLSCDYVWITYKHTLNTQQKRSESFLYMIQFFVTVTAVIIAIFVKQVLARTTKFLHKSSTFSYELWWPDKTCIKLVPDKTIMNHVMSDIDIQFWPSVKKYKRSLATNPNQPNFFTNIRRAQVQLNNVFTHVEGFSHWLSECLPEWTWFILTTCRAWYIFYVSDIIKRMAIHVLIFQSHTPRIVIMCIESWGNTYVWKMICDMQGITLWWYWYRKRWWETFFIFVFTNSLQLISHNKN